MCASSVRGVLGVDRVASADYAGRVGHGLLIRPGFTCPTPPTQLPTHTALLSWLGWAGPMRSAMGTSVLACIPCCI
jgi:hypothetical protein